jgi:hypothetical protein
MFVSEKMIDAALNKRVVKEALISPIPTLHFPKPKRDVRLKVN